MMIEHNDLLFSFIMGIGLGTTFFYGLWLTIINLSSSKAPGLLILLSGILRIGFIIVGFYLVSMNGSDKHLMRLMICLLGFVVARYFVKRFILIKPIEVSRAP